jgi:hypothetical protein
VAYFLFVLPPYSSIRQFVLWVGVSALCSWHGVLEKVFPWKMGPWGDLLITEKSNNNKQISPSQSSWPNEDQEQTFAPKDKKSWTSSIYLPPSPHDQMKTESVDPCPKRQAVGHHPYLYLQVLMTKWRRRA